MEGIPSRESPAVIDEASSLPGEKSKEDEIEAEVKASVSWNDLRAFSRG